MPNWKKVVVSGSSAALSNLTVDNAITASGLIYPSSDGTSGQVISTDGSGNLSFSSVSATDAEATHIPVKNTTASQIDKGTPVYITGNVGASERLQIAPADASDASKMPAVGLLETTLAADGEGYVVQGGYLRQLVTDTIDGTATTSNDTVYVKAGGGLTMTKPTGSDAYIQNIAKIARSHSSAGSVIVSSILRTNDVPNLPTGKIWVGDSNTVTSSVVHLDETNGRLGVNTVTPDVSLHVAGNAKATNLYVAGDIIHTGDADTKIQFDTDTINFDTAGSERLRIDSDGNVGIGTTAPDSKLDVVGNIRLNTVGNELQFSNHNVGAYRDNGNRLVLAGYDGIYFRGSNTDGMENQDLLLRINTDGSIVSNNLKSYQYNVNANENFSFAYGSSSRNSAASPNSYLWHDLLGFDYNYTRTQEVSTDGTNFSSETLQEGLFAQKQDQAIEVLGTSEVAVRWTFQGVAWSVADWMNIAFTHVSSDISKDILIESSTDGTTWTTRHTSTVSGGTKTVSCYVSNYGGDSYLRLTISKNDTSSTNVVRVSSIRLMTVREGDQGQGMEHQFPYTWDYDRRIAIGHSPTTSTYEASLAIKGKTADSTANSLVIRNSSNTSLLSVRNDGRIDVPSGAIVHGGGGYSNTSTDDSYFTGNVGIGTTSPTTPLQVAGNISGSDVQIDDWGSVSASLASINASGYVDGTGAANKVAFWTDTDTLSNDTNLHWDSSNGRLGIGVSNPQRTLQLGDGTTEEFVRSYYSDGSYAEMTGYGLWFSRSTSYLRPTQDDSKSLFLGHVNTAFQYIRLNTSEHTTFYSGSTETMRVHTGDGRVGIGTTSPSYTLDVNSGTVDTVSRFTSSDSISRIEISDDTDSLFVGTQSGKGFLGGASNLSTSNLVVDLTNGNVGIGTTTPTEELEVDGNIYSQHELLYGSNNSLPVGRLYNGGQTAVLLNTSSSGALQLAGGNTTANGGNIFLGGADNASNPNIIRFRIGGTEAARFNSSGNLGIGTSSPTQKLTVAGNITQTSNSFLISTRKITARDGNGLSLYNDGGAGIDVKDSGKVGIGTTTPQAKLHVEGDISGSGNLYLGGDLVVAGTVTAEEFHTEFVSSSIVYQSGSTKFGDTSDDLHSFTGSIGIQSGSLQIENYNEGIEFNSAANRIRLTPAQNLQLYAASSIQFNPTGGSVQVLAGKQLQFNNAANDTSMKVHNGASSGLARLDFEDSSNNILMAISSSGNVGIGTTSPLQTLDVAGPAYFRGGTAADFGNGDTPTDSALIIDEGDYIHTRDGDYLRRLIGKSTSDVIEIGQNGTTLIDNIDIMPGSTGNVRILATTEYVRFDGTNKRVGIGTSSPNEILDIQGDNPIIKLTDNNSTTRYAALEFQSSGGNWFFSSGDSSTGAGVANSDLWITRNEDGTNNRFRFHRDSYAFSIYSGSNQNISLNANDNSYFNGGRVGIGTSSPQKPLHISDSDPTIRLQDSDGSEQWGQIRQAGANFVFTTKNGTSNGHTVFQTYDGTTTVDTLALKTNNQAQLPQYGSGNYSGTAAYTLAVDSSGNIIEESLGAGAVDGSGQANYITRWQDSDTITSSSIYESTAGNIGIGTTNPLRKLSIGADGVGLDLADTSTLGMYTANTERLRIDSDGDVGIGITAPGAKLHIQHTDASKDTLRLGRSDNSSYWRVNHAGNDFRLYNDDASGADILFGVNAGGTVQNNKVGIGTTSPASRLHTVVDFSVSTTDYDDNSTGSRILFKPFSATGNTYSLIQAQDAGGTSNNVLALQPYGDKVGIGTTTPTTLLEVAGDIKVSGSSPSVVFDHPNATYEHELTLRSVSAAGQLEYRYGGGTKVYFKDHSIRFGDYGAGAGTDANSRDPRIYKSGAGTTPGSLVLNTNDTDRIFVSSSGKVGIGTNNPERTLQVGDGTDDDRIRTYHDDGSYSEVTGFGVLFDRSTSYLRPITADTQQLYIGYEAFPWSNIHHNVIGSVTYKSGSTETMRVRADIGKVGIGTTSPDEKLEVYDGDIKLNDGTRQLIIGEEGSTSYQIDSSGFLVIDATSGIQMNKNTSGDVTIASGDVGIGTTSPNSKLEIVESITFANIDTFGQLAIKSTTGTTGDMLNFGVDDTNNVSFIQSVNRGTNTIPLSLQRYGGDVGIGTSTPDSVLHVYDSTSTETTDNGITIENAGTGDAIIQYLLPGVRRWVTGIDNSDNDSFKIASSAGLSTDAALTIKTDGKVGIGSTAPGYQLAVNAGTDNVVSHFYSTDDTAQIQINDDDTTTYFGSRNGLGYISPTGGTPSAGLAISSSGDVLIGTDSRSTVGGTAKLTVDVGSNTAKPVSIVNGTTDGMYIRRYDTGGSYQLQTTVSSGNAGNLSLQTYGGNVGIGTTSPSQALTVEGAISSSGDIYIGNDGETNTLHFNTTTGNIVKINGNTGMNLYSDNQVAFIESDAGTTKLVASTNNGTFSINTNSEYDANIKLYVNGDSRIDGTLQIESGNISYQENTDVDSAAAETVASVTIADFDAAFFDYVIKSGTNLRAGTVTAVHDGTNVEYNEVSTQDLGDTTDVTLSVDISGADMRLRATTTSDNWEIKSLVRTI